MDPDPDPRHLGTDPGSGSWTIIWILPDPDPHTGWMNQGRPLILITRKGGKINRRTGDTKKIDRGKNMRCTRGWL
jgi:hypothetical protein